MNTASNIQKLLIVDDDLSLQIFLQEYLSKHDYEVTVISQGEAIESLMQQHAYALVILDVVLPGKDGFYWLSWLKQNHSEIKVLMLSIMGEVDDRIMGLESGASDYLVKPFNLRELLARVNNLLWPICSSEQKISFGNYCFDLTKYSLTQNGRPISLTFSEVILLRYLCSNRFITVTRNQLNQVLQGVESVPLNTSLDDHIFNLRNKVERDPSTPEYIHTILGKGYCFNA